MHGEMRGEEGPARGEPAARVAPGCGPGGGGARRMGAGGCSGGARGPEVLSPAGGGAARYRRDRLLGRAGRCGGVAEKEAGRQGAGTFSRDRQERALPLVVALGRDGRWVGVIAECCDCIVQSLHCAIRSGGGVSPAGGCRGRAGRASSKKRERACVVVVYPGVNWRAGRCRPR